MQEDIECGDKVRCKITGFKGIVTTITHYINGCTQVGITPKMDKGGKYPDSVEVDIGQIEILNEKIKIRKRKTGGPINRRSAIYRRK